MRGGTTDNGETARIAGGTVFATNGCVALEGELATELTVASGFNGGVAVVGVKAGFILAGCGCTLCCVLKRTATAEIGTHTG
jgi:hypothetical protein